MEKEIKNKSINSAFSKITKEIQEIIKEKKSFFSTNHPLLITFKTLDEYTSKKDYYQFLLHVKSSIRKIVNKFNSNYGKDNLLIKEISNQLLDLLYFTIFNFYENNQDSLTVDFLIYVATDFKNYKSDILPDKDIIDFFSFSYNTIRFKDIKTSQLESFIVNYLTNKGIKTDDSKLLSGLYRIFSEENIFKNEPILGYKYSILSNDINLIETIIEIHRDNTKDENGNKSIENIYLLVRTTMELLIKREFKSATFLIIKLGLNRNNLDNSTNLNSNKIDVLKTTKNTHPLVNFTLCIISCLNQKLPHVIFTSLCKSYSKWLENDKGILKKYINKISEEFYNKTIIRENTGLNIMNLLSSLG